MHCYSYINVNENLMVLCVTTNLTLTYLSPFTLPPLYLTNMIMQEYFISSVIYPPPPPLTLPPHPHPPPYPLSPPPYLPNIIIQEYFISSVIYQFNYG